MYLNEFKSYLVVFTFRRVSTFVPLKVIPLKKIGSIDLFSNFVNTLSITKESKRRNKKEGCPTSLESYS